MKTPQVVIALCLAVVMAAAIPLSAATATASSNSLWYGTSATKKGSATWTWWDPSPSDTITWSSGTNYADGTPYTHTPISETKFTFTGTVITGKKAFTGFSYSDGPGLAGSVALTSGGGRSTYTRKKAMAHWHVTATGTLGSSPPPIPSWDSTASGNDPLSVLPSHLAGFTGGYSLFFAAGLESASFSKNGEVQYSVSYSTADTFLHLLGITLGPTGATVSGDTIAGLSIYSLPSLTITPDSSVGTLVSLAQIQAQLQGDLSNDHLVSPEYYGFVLNGLPIPTIDLGDGSVAHVDEDATAIDSAVGSPIPEPSSLFLLGSGVLGFAGLLRKRLLTRS